MEAIKALSSCRALSSYAYAAVWIVAGWAMVTLVAGWLYRWRDR